MKEATKTANKNLRIETILSTKDFIQIQIQMPMAEFNALEKAMRRNGTMEALCMAATKTGLAKAMKGSTFCATCHSNGIQHQFTAKNWFNAFWEALFHCGPGFALQRRACTPSFGPVVNHNGGGSGSGGGGGGAGGGGGSGRPRVIK